MPYRIHVTKRALVTTAVFLIILAGISGDIQQKMHTSQNDEFSDREIVYITTNTFNEPSGIVFHPQRGTLFIVGDNGDVGEITKDGILIRQRRIRPADFEGITCDPSSGLLYIAVEGEEIIIEIDPDDFTVLREFSIERTFRGAVVLKAGGQGIEGITFVPEPDHPEGGIFYAANQSMDLSNTEDPSAIFEVELPLRSGSGQYITAKILSYFSLNTVDLSGLYYDTVSDHLFVISDRTNTFLEITRDSTVLGSHPLPGKDQEGITLDDEGYMYIAQDSGGIIKMKPNR